MSPAVITLIAWAPFLVLALIFGIVFCLLGYKRGSARAAISVAVTAIAAVLSVVFAKLLSGSLAGMVKPIIDDMLNNSSTEGIEALNVSALATGLASALCALVLFIPVFILLTSILKPVVSVIVKRFIPKPVKPVNKIGGLAISLVDAFLVALLALLPVYGTLSLVKEASPLLKNEKEIYPYVSAATDPFIVDVAGVPPFSTAYDALFSFKVDAQPFNVSGTIRTTLRLVDEVNAFTKLEDKFSDEKLLLSIINDAEEFLISNEYASDILCNTIAEKVPDVEIPGLGKISISEYYVSLGDSKLLRNDLPAFFDLARSMIKSGMLGEITSKDGFDINNVNASVASKAFGNTFNHSDEIAAFKSRLIKDIFTAMTDEIIEGGKDKNGAVAALKNAILAMPESRYGKDDAQKEGESLFMITSGLVQMKDENKTGMAMGYMIEGLARHPAIGAEVVMNAAGAFLSESGASGEQLLDKIGEKLEEAVTKPVGQSKFPEFVDTAFDTVGALGDIQSGNADSDSIKDLITAEPEAVESMKDVLSEDILKEVGMGDMSEKMNTVLDAIFDSIITSDFSEEEAEKEAEALFEMMSVLIDVAGNPEGTASAIESKADDMIKYCAESVILENTLINLTKDGQSDPMGMFSGLDSTAKNEIEGKIDSYIAENGESSSLNALKQFIGLK